MNTKLDNEILQQIVDTKLLRLKQKGASLGFELKERLVPVIKPTFPLFICEIKRKSPTQGVISSISNPVQLAKRYINNGANAISVLCEEDFFNGSLNDLIDIKNDNPDTCILRKDFILHREEIKYSYFAGADMVLLIVAVFMNEKEKFIEILKEIQKYGLHALIEVHDDSEIEFLMHLDSSSLESRLLENAIFGINSRNLKTFRINKAKACILRQKLPQKRVIFESGINSARDTFMASSSGFDGFLCGSFLVKNVENENNLDPLINLIESFKNGQKNNFYKKLYEKIIKENAQNRPLVKVCGNNDLAFLKEVVKFTPLIGFVLHKKSPRFVDKDFLIKASKMLCGEILNADVLRVGVVKESDLDVGLECLDLGLVDALQLHDFANWKIKDYSFCAFSSENIENITDSNFILIDNSEGSGKEINLDSLNNISNEILCISGGIGVNNLEKVLKVSPAVIDLCSSLESAPGVKSIDKLKDFFKKFI